MELQIPDKFRPLWEPHRYKVAFSGRDAGKSWQFARTLLVQAIKQPLRILCAREVQRSIKDSVYKLLVDQIELLGLGGYYEILSQEIRGINGSLFLFTGLSDQTSTSLKSYEKVDRLWIEEAQTISKQSLRVIIPTIRAPGSEIWISFNPEMDTDEVYQRFIVNTPSDCVLMNVSYLDNPWASKVLDAERARMRVADPDEYAHVWEGACKPAVEGAIYYKEVSALRATGRLCNVPYDPMLKVHVVCDLGFNDYMSLLLVQRLASEVRVIRYIEDRQRDIPSYSQEMKDIRERGVGLNFGTVWLPHDGRRKTLEAVNNPAGATAQEQFEKLGWKTEIVDNIEIEQGIRKTREVFPRLYIDAVNASALLNRLGRYRRRVDPNGQAGRPKHDDESHGSDAARYLAIIADQLSNDDGRTVIKDPYAAFRRGGFASGASH